MDKGLSGQMESWWTVGDQLDDWRWRHIGEPAVRQDVLGGCTMDRSVDSNPPLQYPTAMLKTVGALDSAADGCHVKMGSRKIEMVGAGCNDWPEGRNVLIGSKNQTSLSALVEPALGEGWHHMPQAVGRSSDHCTGCTCSPVRGPPTLWRFRLLNGASGPHRGDPRTLSQASTTIRGVTRRISRCNARIVNRERGIADSIQSRELE